MRTLLAAATAVVVVTGAISAAAQTYPNKSVTIIVPFAAGGPSDALARIMGERMKVSLGQSFVVENVTGAAGSIASAAPCARRRTATPSASGISARMSPTARSIRCPTTCSPTSSRW